MKYYILASGSKGNCTVIENDDTMIIIDCGQTWKYLSQEFHNNNIDYKLAKGMLITHGHSDHIQQLKRFEFMEIYGKLDDQRITPIEYYQCLEIGSLKITPLALSHDFYDTTGYLIEDKKEKLVYITDTGYINKKNNYKYIENADYYIIESNHDTTMLRESNRPWIIKERILSDVGHLSNEDCCRVLLDNIGDKTKEIALAHLSQETNTPELAYQCIIDSGINVNKITVKIAEQFKSIQGGIK